MSASAQAWAWSQDLPSSEKFVLVCVSDWAADDEVFASVPSIARKTGLNPKTVRSALQRLVARGLLLETDERRGKTKQIVVYRITFSEDLFAEKAKAGSADGVENNPAKNGSLPKTGAFQNRQALGGKGSQKRQGKGSQNWEGEDSQIWEAELKEELKLENNNNRAREELDLDGAQPDGELPTDAVQLARQCCELAHIAGADAGQRQRLAVKVVQGWLDAGADAEMILAEVEAGRDKASDGVNSLNYFSPAILRRLERAGFAAARQPRRAAKARPVVVADDDGAEARAIKLRVQERMRQATGDDASWSAWVAPCRFELSGDAGGELRVVAPSRFAADWMRDNLRHYVQPLAGARSVEFAAAAQS